MFHQKIKCYNSTSKNVSSKQLLKRSESEELLMFNDYMNMDYFRLWTLLLINIVYRYSVVKTNEFLSLIGSEDGQFCITNSSSAMYYTTSNGSIHERTTILPRSCYFCEFGGTGNRQQKKKCCRHFEINNEGWQKVNSLQYENLPIFDSRWEEFPVEELNAKENKPNKLSFRKMLDIEKMENFKVTISLRASEVHLLLCDVLKISKASCYWFILQGWGGKKTVMRKCTKQILEDDRKFPDPPCRKPLVTISHPIDYPMFLGMKMWSHVILEKQGRNFRLRIIRNTKTETILNYTDTGNIFKLKYLLGHTKDAAAFYKIHQHDYLRTTYVSNANLTTLETIFLRTADEESCVCLLLTTCADCWTVVVKKSSGKFIDGIKLPPSYGVWRKYKFKFNAGNDFHYSIAFRTITTNESNPITEKFWSIDNIRPCSEEEYRVSPKITNLVSCHLLYPSHEITSLELKSIIPETKCQSRDRFGESCVPCDLLKEDGLIHTCKKLRVCELITKNRRCFCSPGYTGPDCNRACEDGTYGNGCLQQCGNCLGNAACSVEDGSCKTCEKLFEGPTCKKPKKDIVLKTGPSIIESSSNSCTVQLINPEYFGESEPNCYLMQYQKLAVSKSPNRASGDETWKDCDYIRKINDVPPVTVEDLNSSSSYRIRILVAKDTLSIKNLQKSKVPYTVCNTTCNASELTYGLKTTWQENNTLALSWTYQNKTNDNLKLFRISIWISGGSSKNYDYIVKDNDDRMIYHMQLNESFPPSSDLHIQITTENCNSSKPTSKTDSSFPVKPVLIDPDISITNSSKSTITVSMNVMLNENARVNANYLFILITDPNTNIKDQNILKLENVLHTTIDEETKFRMVAEIMVNDLTTTELIFTVGENYRNKKSALLNSEIFNKPLQEGKSYNITVLLVSDFKKKYRFNNYSIGNVTTLPKIGEIKKLAVAYYALLLLLLMPLLIGAFIYCKRVNGKSTTRSRHLYANTRGSFLSNTYEEPIAKERFEVNVPANISSTGPLHSEPVRVANFEKYVKTSIIIGDLERQYDLLSPDQIEYSEYHLPTISETNNIYLDLVTYDHARVKLKQLPGEKQCLYINASFVDGYNTPRAYMATQNPKAENFEIFWSMIWQKNVKHIFMLSNIRGDEENEVDRFWPNIHEEMIFFDISVRNLHTTVSADFESRTFKLMRKNEERKVKKILFANWPSDDVPFYPQSLIPFVAEILNISLSTSSPIVVQCNNGVGETGTILLIDISLRMALEKGVVDILNNFHKLRIQKAKMVVNVKQYKLAHLVVLQMLNGVQTSIPCSRLNEMTAKIIDEEEYKIQMDYLKNIAWQNQAMERIQLYTDLFFTRPEKNRMQDIVPGDFGRVYLEINPTDDESSSYINAVQVDGYKYSGRYIVTQQPMPNTLGDFWRLVSEKNIKVIISLNEVDMGDKTCCEFLPTADNTVLCLVNHIRVLFRGVVEMQNHNILSLEVDNRKKKRKVDVEVLVFNKWPVKKLLPFSCEEFVSFWEEVDTMSKRSRQILVTCFDGATASGVFVALSFIIEKMKVEQKCDVCQAVQIVRRNRKQFVTEESQFIFLFMAAVRFINGFHAYSNFQKK